MTDASLIAGSDPVLATKPENRVWKKFRTHKSALFGGVLVGVGVTLGSGCTSGHGVCGMARLSRRSFAATATFMLTTGLTVYGVRHLWGG